MDNTKKQQKKKGANWIGWLIFFILVFGPNIIRPVSRVISQVTGGTVNIGVNIIPAIIGIIAVVMVLTSILRAAARYSKRNETTLPTTLSSPSSSSSSSSPSWSDIASSTTFSTKSLSTSSSTSSDWFTSGRQSQPVKDDADERFDSLFDYDDDEEETQWQGGFSRPHQPATPKRLSDIAPPVRFEPVISGKAILAAIVAFLLVGGGLAFGGIMSGMLP